jgi:hypothetical protein
VISQKRRTIDDTINIAREAPVSDEIQNCLAILIATSVQRLESVIVMNVVPMRITTRRDSLFLFMRFRNLAPNLFFLRYASILCSEMDIKGISLQAKNANNTKKMKNKIIDHGSMGGLLLEIINYIFIGTDNM